MEDPEPMQKVKELEEKLRDYREVIQAQREHIQRLERVLMENGIHGY